MPSLIRGVLAIIAGFVAASAVMMAIEFVNGHHIYPELGKAAEGVTDPNALRALLATAPAGAFLVVLFGWALGSFVGGFTAAKIAKPAAMRHALIVGVLLTLAGIANNLMIPPPLWFWWVSMLVFVPAAHLGGKIAT